MGSRASVLRMSMSSVPCTTSRFCALIGLLSITESSVCLLPSMVKRRLSTGATGSPPAARAIARLEPLQPPRAAKS